MRNSERPLAGICVLFPSDELNGNYFDLEVPIWESRHCMAHLAVKTPTHEADPLPSRWCQIRLAMIDTVGGCEWRWGLRRANAHLDEVNDPIALWRRKSQTVFVADELRDLGVSEIEFLFGRGEV